MGALLATSQISRKCNETHTRAREKLLGGGYAVTQKTSNHNEGRFPNQLSFQEPQPPLLPPQAIVHCSFGIDPFVDLVAGPEQE